MSTKRKILIVLCLVGIFVAGCATGLFAALRFARNHGPVDRFVVRQLDRMTKELELTPEQNEKIDQILRESGGQISDIRQESIRQSAVCFKEMNQKISSVLNPDQKVKFEEFLKKQRERIRKFQQERGDRRRSEEGSNGGQGDEPPPPPPPDKGGV